MDECKSKSIDKRSSTMMDKGQAEKSVPGGLELMATATGLRGGAAKEKFQGMAEKVFGLMLNQDVHHIHIKKTTAGKIRYIKAH